MAELRPRRNRHPAAKPIHERIEAAIQSDRARASRPKRNPGNHEAPLSSPAEQTFRALATELGWEVHRSGWPDFFLTRAGELLLVEVKGANDRLRPAQAALFTAFEAHGIHVKIWWANKPDFLLPWRRFQRLTDATRVGSSMGRVGSDTSKVERIRR